MLSKEQILGFNDVKIEKVSVPEWNADLYVKTISAKTQDVWMEDCRNQRKSSKANFQASYLVHCICDENGSNVFSPSDADALGEKSASALNRLWDVASTINALNKKDSEALEKNSVATRAEDSISS